MWYTLARTVVEKEEVIRYGSTFLDWSANALSCVGQNPPFLVWGRTGCPLPCVESLGVPVWASGSINGLQPCAGVDELNGRKFWWPTLTSWCSHMWP